MTDTCPQDITKTLMRLAKNVHWQKLAKKHEIEELKEGVSFEPMNALLQRKPNRGASKSVDTQKALRHELGQ